MSEPVATSVLLTPALWEALGLTLRLATTTTLVLAVIGLPLAHWLNRTRWRIAPAIETLVALPVVLPPTVIGFYLLVAFSPQHPPGSWWRELTGAPLSFSFTGLVIASVFYSLPFAVQPFQAALRGVSPELLEAGRALGASPLRVFLRLHAPLAWRGIAAGLTLGFAHTLGELFAQQHADVAVEFVHLAHGMHAQAVFADAAVVAQAGGAVVAGAGGDLCESVAHAVCPVCAQSALPWLLLNAACEASPCGPGNWTPGRGDCP